MPTFDSPNYTQVPNDLFEIHMAHMGEAELRIVLAIMRQTLGYHRLAARYSLTDLQTMTGLSRSSLLGGIEQAVEHGFISKEKDGGVTCWILSIADSAVSAPVRKAEVARQTRQTSAVAALGEKQVARQTRQTSAATAPPSIKENLKKDDEKESAKESDPITPRQAKLHHLDIGPEPTPALRAYLHAANAAQQPQTPPPAVRAAIDETVTDLVHWAEHLHTWMMKGYRFANVADLLETYKTGLRSNGNGRPGIIKSTSSYTADV